jgi:hypothetical protein
MKANVISSEPMEAHAVERPVQWWTGIKAALAIGAIFWLVARGIPWAPSGLVSPTVMGREIKNPGALDFNVAGLASILTFVCAVVYGCIMMPLIHRFTYSNAWLVGAALGIICYILNLAAFALFGDGAPFSRELPVFVTHVAFGIIFTGAYKGLVKRRVDQVS